jgi:hypothetical protein
MNIFNVVLAAIRLRCAQTDVPYADCFDFIKEKIDVKYHENLDFYLDFLQDLGLIKYSIADRHITLTARGRATETLFT